MGRTPDEAEAKRARMDRDTPGWREARYPSGRLVYAPDGTMLNDSEGKDGFRGRSIFDDVDE